MQIMITHGSAARTRVLRVHPWQLAAALIASLSAVLFVAGGLYHVVFLKAAREGWPLLGAVASPAAQDSYAQRDRFMRENLDAMARKVGEMQAKLIKLEAVGDRVSGLAGIKPDEVAATPTPTPAATAPRIEDGKGGPFVPAPEGVLRPASLEHLDSLVGSLDEQADASSDLFTLVESRLLEKKLLSLMVPTTRPVDGPVGSGFGYRSDPFSGHAALHTGLDFPAETGTAIHASAGGVVLTDEMHPAYGHMVEIDHGRGLVTRYAHTSKVLVHPGDIVKRGQVIALVGTTGRSTGPHLHFEVLVDGATQDPSRFLARGEDALAAVTRGTRRSR